MKYLRATMGQDWGGRQKMNPDNVQKVTKKDVISFAKSKGLEVMREGGNFSMWWLMKDGKKIITLGMTNYIALNTLKDYL